MNSCDPRQRKFAPIPAAAVPNCVGRDETATRFTRRPLPMEEASDIVRLVIDDQKLAITLSAFAAERDWDQFHTPKNLATSISVEAAELLELFQWSRGQKGWDEVTDPSVRTRVEEELADILLYVIRFADKAGIDLQSIAERKIALNAAIWLLRLRRSEPCPIRNHS